MARTFVSPGKYIQGAGELKNLGKYASQRGRAALVLISEGGRKRCGADIEKSFADADVPATFATFCGECTHAEIDRLIAVAKETGADVMVGVGGGKIFDTAKAVAYQAKMAVIIAPTIAATDAPCSGLSVIYTADGAVDQYLFLNRNPDLVVMDTEVIAKSPVRLTVSGMGDALATYFEARAVNRCDGVNFAEGQQLHASMALAKLCYDMLLENGPQARLALEKGAVTPAVEAIIEANTLLSGLGFECGGLAAAHAVHNGLCSLPECHHMYHGEKVAIGVLAQLVLEHAAAEEIRTVLDFCLEVGLPVTLADIGVTEVTWEKLLQVGTLACADGDTGRNMPFPVTPEMYANAILAADALGQDAKKGK
ncbi:MAG: glycerol dehydrogenase [Clostridiales bacterium]|nr:glycerol dehydrogenase [Clostridiales bacterium]